jgi:Ribbon-helix-helix protein, copG family
MAMMTIKSTYALDADSVRTLEQQSRRWRVSKSEALRRAIRAAAGQAAPQGTEALRALDRFQRALDLTPARVAGRGRSARGERRGVGRVCAVPSRPPTSSWPRGSSRHPSPSSNPADFRRFARAGLRLVP